MDSRYLGNRINKTSLSFICFRSVCSELASVYARVFLIVLFKAVMALGQDLLISLVGSCLLGGEDYMCESKSFIIEY